MGWWVYVDLCVDAVVGVKTFPFQFLSPIQKSVTVKVVALTGFVVAYLVVKLLVS